MIYCDKAAFYIYNEEEEKSECLRKVTGAHKHSITTMAHDEHLSLVATGTENGEVAVWDYELSHLLGVCLGHNRGTEVTQIAFLAPYPVMVTSGADCKICLWSVRPIPSKECYICFQTFINVSFNYHDEQTFPVRAISVWHGEKLKGISRGKAMKHQ